MRKLIFLFSTFCVVLTLASCGSDQSSLDPELKSLAGEVDQLHYAINRKDLLKASTKRDRDGILTLLLDIKIGLLQLAENSNNRDAYRQIQRCLKELEFYQMLKRDRVTVENLTLRVYAKVDKMARKTHLKLSDFTWTLFATQFSEGLDPFTAISNGQKWDPNWSLDDSYVRVTGSDNLKSRLVSPTFDLQGVKDPSFYIEHTLLINRNTGRFATDEFNKAKILKEAFVVEISNDYDPIHPEDSTWTRVSINPLPNSDDFHVISSPRVDLRPFQDKPVTIAFSLNINPSRIGHHYLTWQIYRFALEGAGELAPFADRPRTLLDHQFSTRDSLNGFTQHASGDADTQWSLMTINNNTFAKIGSNGKEIDTWLISPKYHAAGQQHLSFTLSETVKNPEFENFRVLISSNYNGGDPSLASWIEVPHTPGRPVPADSWKDLTSELFDLSAFANQDFTIAFEFINHSQSAPIIWELKGFQIIGIGDDIVPMTKDTP